MAVKNHLHSSSGVQESHGHNSYSVLFSNMNIYERILKAKIYYPPNLGLMGEGCGVVAKN